MSDSIQSIRYVPQINKLGPKGKVGNEKGGKEKKQDFSKNKSVKNNDEENDAHDQVKEEIKNKEHQEKETGDSVQNGIDHEPDMSSGSILNTEV